MKLLYGSMVDEEDFFYLLKWKWYKDSKGYLKQTVPPYQFMHILIVEQFKEIPEGFEIDHFDRNTMNNQRSNLKIVSHSINIHNAKIQSNNTSGHKGITFRRGKWIARIDIKGKRTTLGTFIELDNAIKARTEAEKQFGISEHTFKGS